MPSEDQIQKVEDFSISKASRQDIRYICDSHYHDSYEIYYLTAGTRRQFVDHKIYDIRKGDLILIPRRVIHKTTAIDRNRHTRYLLSFSEEFARDVCAGQADAVLDGVFSAVKLTVPEAQRDYVLELFDRISLESGTAATDPLSRIMVKSCVSQLLVFICRCNRKRPAEEQVEAIPEEKIQQAAKYICDHFRRPLSLEEVASQVYMSQTYFSKKFRKVTGMNFREYLLSVRIRAADELLLETNRSVSDIAAECGFGDANYFGDVFKKMMGVSPMKYRKSRGRT